MASDSTENLAARREFVTGIRDQLPLLLGVVPFGMIFGALAVAAGIPPLAAQGLSFFVFAGSAQFLAVGLIAANAPAIVIVLTILIVNLRHMLYSASAAPYFSHLPLRWRGAIAWLLTDEAFAVASVRLQQADTRLAHWYTLGTGLALWAAWQASSALGILLGARVPESWSLEFALPLTFLALLMPTLKDRPAVAAAVVGGLVAVVLGGAPYRLGLISAILAGVAVGMVWEMRSKSRSDRAREAA
jgi:4-azaleucine resistance transporter AzlC